MGIIHGFYLHTSTDAHAGVYHIHIYIYSICKSILYMYRVWKEKRWWWWEGGRNEDDEEEEILLIKEK